MVPDFCDYTLGERRRVCPPGGAGSRVEVLGADSPAGPRPALQAGPGATRHKAMGLGDQLSLAVVVLGQFESMSRRERRKGGRGLSEMFL